MQNIYYIYLMYIHITLCICKSCVICLLLNNLYTKLYNNN